MMKMGTTRRDRDGVILETIYSMIPFLLILVACADLYDAATVVDVYRLIQYDIGGVPFGSRLASLNHHAGSLPFASNVDLARTVVILPVRELNLSFIKEYISQRQPLGGLLFLLPPILRSESPRDKDRAAEHHLRSTVVELEQFLIHANIPYPVYFAFEDDNIDAVLAEVKKNDITGQPATATTGGYKFVVSAPEPKKLASPIITNIQGWLPGFKADGDSNQLPTIAIVASYDTFGAAPALSVGSDSNGSGIAALLEIARLFSRLYSSPKTRGRYNILFGLTSGGPYNYNGTQKWLRSFDQRLRESVDYAICLNSIGSLDNELWLHVSKPPENAYIKQIFEGFTDVAEDLGLKINLKHKKINISNPRVAWEHEQFSRLRVTAATLSGLSAAPEMLENTGGLFDSRQSVNETSIIRGVKLVAESLVRHIYGHQGKDIQIFADNSNLAVNPSYIKSWLDILSRTPRVAPFFTKNDPFVMALKKELSEHTTEVNVQNEALDEMFTFYDSTKATLNIYQVASVTFDLLLLLVLGSYLIVLFSFLVITTKVAWEHEQFSRLRVTAATLSGLSAAPEMLENTGGLFDSRQSVNETSIIRGVKLVAESLVRHIYGHQGKDIQIFADNSNLAVNPSYIKSWLDILLRTPRVAPFFTKNDPFVMALKKELSEHTTEVNVQNEALDEMFTFYDSTKATLNIYQVASVTFDLLLLLVLGSYLIVLFSFLVITTKGLDDLISLFRRPPSRKVKTA